MSVCEFDTKINNGFIRVPELYENRIGTTVKVILLYDEETVKQTPFLTLKVANENIQKPIKRHKTFKQRLIDFYGANYDPNKIREEIKETDWGNPVGAEIW